MDMQRKIILYAWLLAAVLGLTLILLTRSKSSSDKNLSAAIIGTWKGVGLDETDQFREDGSVLVEGQGKKGVLKFSVFDSQRLQFVFEGQPPRIYKDVSIKADRLTMTNATTGDTISYTRIESTKDLSLQQTKNTRLASPSPLPSDQPRQIPPPPVAPQQQTTSKKTGKLKDDILGKWKLPGQNETNEWLEDGTVVMTDNQGKATKYRYMILNSNVKIFPEDENPTTADMFLAEIDGDILSLTTPTQDGPVTERFVRVNANGTTAQASLPEIPTSLDSNGILGKWRSKNSDEVLVFSQNGTFQFGEDKGRWQIVGGQVVAKEASGAITWKMTLSPDRQQLSGHFSRLIHNMGVAGAVTVTR